VERREGSVSERITDDPVIAAQLAGLLRRGLTRHHARERAGEPEPPEVTREREKIAAMLATRRQRRARHASDTDPSEAA
jgi:hypothetical protein